MKEVTKEQIANLLKIQSPNGLPKEWLNNTEIVAAITGGSVTEEKAVEEKTEIKTERTHIESFNNLFLYLESKETSSSSDLIFIAENLGKEQDLKGAPLTGAAGELLTAAIEKGMKLKRSDVCITNVLQNNENSDQSLEESNLKDFQAKLNTLKPKAILVLGQQAMKALFKNDPSYDPEMSIEDIRGNWLEWNSFEVMPSYHPADILKNPAIKKEFWVDLKLVMAKLGL